MSDELDRLEALGRTAPPPADPAFVAGLARRLGRTPQRSAFRMPVLLPAAAVIAIVVGLGVLLFGGGDDGGGGATIVVENAVDATVSSGQQLGEGAVIETGPTGSVTAGGETIGPGERAVVRRGKVERRRIPETLTLEGVRLPRGGASLQWSRYDGADFGRYVILRGLRVRTALPSQDQLTFVDRVPRARQVRYVVVVLDSSNHAVARSNVILE